MNSEEVRDMVSELLMFCNTYYEKRKNIGDFTNSQKIAELDSTMSQQQNDLPIRYHVHVDADRISKSLEKKLLETGYQVTDFIKHDGTEPRPRFIRTKKFIDSKKYNIALKEVTQSCKLDSEFVGFVEGEVIAGVKNIEYKIFTNVVPLPFLASTEYEPGGYSKNSDMHVTLCPIRTDRRILESLIIMGYSCVLSEKPWGLAAVFSLQGSKEIISRAYEETCRFLTKCGGAAKCCIKDERISFLWVSGENAPKTRVVKKMNWNSSGI